MGILLKRSILAIGYQLGYQKVLSTRVDIQSTVNGTCPWVLCAAALLYEQEPLDTKTISCMVVCYLFVCLFCVLDLD